MKSGKSPCNQGNEIGESPLRLDEVSICQWSQQNVVSSWKPTCSRQHSDWVQQSRYKLFVLLRTRAVNSSTMAAHHWVSFRAWVELEGSRIPILVMGDCPCPISPLQSSLLLEARIGYYREWIGVRKPLWLSLPNNGSLITHTWMAR